LALHLLGPASSPCPAAEGEGPEAEVAAPEESADVRTLITQLGSDDFRTREAATEALIALGSVVAPYIDEAADSPNLEIQTRAARIRAIISHQSFEDEIQSFLADTDGTLGTTLPGWERARQRLGHGPDARALYAEMYRAEPTLLKAYGQDDAATASSFNIRVDELHDQHTQQNRINYRIQNQLQQAVAMNVMALLFVGADEAFDVSTTSITKFKLLFMQSWPPQRVAAAPERSHLRDWLATWVVKRFGEPHREYEGMTLGMQYDVPQTIELALRVLRRKDNQSFTLMNAALCVGQYGEPWHLPLLEPLLTDPTRVQERHRPVNNRMVRYETQLRDVALLVLIYRTGQEAKVYGFEEIDRSAGYMFLPHTMAFEQPDARDEALATWHAWRKEHTLFEGEPPAPGVSLELPETPGNPPTPE
jgi:hypothetical protein